MCCNKCRAHGDFCFAKPDITAYESVHHFFCAHIVLYRFNGNGLIGRFLEVETRAKLIPSGLVKNVCKALTSLSFGINFQKLCRNVRGSLRRLPPGFTPLFSAESMKRCRIRISAAVTADEMQRSNGDIELVVISVLKQKEFCVVVINTQFFKTHVTADTVLQVHDGKSWS